MSTWLSRIAILPVVLIALALSGIGVAGAAQAATSGDEIPIDQGAYRGTPWVSGGVGVSAREALIKEYDDFNLKLEFAVAEGSYLADVAVSINTLDGVPVLRPVSVR